MGLESGDSGDCLAPLCAWQISMLSLAGVSLIVRCV
jgi:hypothetical protein